MLSIKNRKPNDDDYNSLTITFCMMKNQCDKRSRIMHREKAKAIPIVYCKIN